MALMLADTFEVLFAIFPILFIGVFIFIIVTVVRQFAKNEKSPVVATKARVIEKRTESSTHHDANGHMHTSHTYYLVFELSTGSTMRLSVGSGIQRDAREFEWGILTFQGTRFLRFESESGTLEK